VDGSLRPDPAHVASVATVVGIGGYLLVVLWGILLLSVFGRPSELVERQILNGAALALAALLTTRVFLAWAELDWSFLDLSRPTLRQLAWGGVGLLGLVGLTLIVGALGIPTAEHGLTDRVREAGRAALWILVPISILVVGPAEELVYRNLVQKTLAEGFQTMLAVVGASVIFAIAHLPAYLTSDPIATAGSLTVVFLLSCILGGVYAQTRNLMTVALVHGMYDAVAFADVFVDLV
jgi:membrane protease YdiL (CAAX protease family)